MAVLGLLILGAVSVLGPRLAVAAAVPAAEGAPSPLDRALGRLVRQQLSLLRERARSEAVRRHLKARARALAAELEVDARRRVRLQRARARLQRRLQQLEARLPLLATKETRVVGRAERLLPALLDHLRRAPPDSPQRRRAQLLWRLLQQTAAEARARRAAIRQARDRYRTALLRVEGRLAQLTLRLHSRAQAVAAVHQRLARLQAAQAARALRLQRLRARHAQLVALRAQSRQLMAATLIRDPAAPASLLPATIPAARIPTAPPLLVARAAIHPLQRLPLRTLPPPARLRMAQGPGLGLMPAEGVLLARFGEVRGGVRARGLTLAVRRPQTLRAPRSGRVAFAGPFGDWGAVLILDHGDGYHTLIAGAGRLDVARGDRVAAGAAVGAAWPQRGRAGHLYVELRFRGRPIDPLAGVAATSTNDYSG